MNKLALIEKEAAEELDQLKARIVEYDREFHSAFQRQMGFAFLAGAALLRAKEIVPHGQFMAWREAELSVERSSAERYMKFADAVGKFPTVGNLKEVKLLGEGEPLTAAQQKKITEAVHELADGKTLTEMYRDLGVIRQPEKPKHHPRKPVDPGADLDAQKAWSLDLRNAWSAPLRVFLTALADEEGDHVHLPKKEWQACLDILTEATAEARKRLKGGAQ
jgi:hypothetical protein